MVYGSASIYYVRYSVLGKCLWLTFTTINTRLWLLTLVLLIAFFINNISLFIFRLLDEIFFSGYRKNNLKPPVFIIANPRSGTTFLHKIMSMDDKRFTYMKFAHTIFCSATFVKLAQFIKQVDSKTGNNIASLVNRIDDKMYAGWEDIHKMGFNETEEDEALFAQSMMSTGIFVLFPFFDKVKDTHLLDHEPAHVRKNMMQFYKSSIKRFVYARNKHKTYLAKNVNSCGRIQSILATFPDAKFIYIARNPYDAVPSMVSMFSTMYGFHSPSMPKSHPTYQEWAHCSIAYYNHFSEVRKTIQPENFFTIKYDNLVEQPMESVLSIYKHFGWEASPEFKSLLSKETGRQKNYQSKHQYSLSEYSVSDQLIADKLQPFLNEFEFVKPSK